MPRCNWLYHVAVRGFLIALSLFLVSGSLPEEPNQPSVATNNQQPTAERENTNQPVVATSEKESGHQNKVAGDSGLAEGEKPNRPIYRSPCGDTYDHGEADLCEQKRMSASAEKAADYAFWQLIVSGIGLAIIAASLIFAGIGAFAARDAALATAAQARIMRSADRPYLIPRDPELLYVPDVIRGTARGKAIELRFGFENLGKGVCFFDSYAITHEICKDGEQGTLSPEIKSGFARMPISAGGVWQASTAIHYLGLSQDEKDDLLYRRKSIFIYGYSRYSDIYGVFRRTGFMFEYFVSVFGADGEGFLVMHRSPGWWYDIEENPTGQKRRWYQRKSA